MSVPEYTKQGPVVAGPCFVYFAICIALFDCERDDERCDDRCGADYC